MTFPMILIRGQGNVSFLIIVPQDSSKGSENTVPSFSFLLFVNNFSFVIGDLYYSISSASEVIVVPV